MKTLPKRDFYLAGGILLVASFLRLYNLGDVPLFFDESVHSVIVEQLIRGVYSYDPRFHGPLLYYSLAPFVTFLGKSEFSLRLLPALLGIAFIASIFLYKRYLGDRVYIAALFVAITPIIVNYSRFCRADVYQLLFTSLFVYFLIRYLEMDEGTKSKLKLDRRSLWLILAAIPLALFATVKETFYVFAAMLLIYLIFDIKKFRLMDLLSALTVFFLIYAALYTNFFTEMTILTNVTKFPAVQAIDYWRGQHEIARIAGPWYYHLELLVLYDFPVLCLALYTLYWRIRGEGKDEFTSIFSYLFIANLAFFSYMQEKVPWLAVHVEFPMIMLAAKSAGKRKALLILSVAFLLYGSLSINVINPVNPAEPALYLPTQYDVKTITANFSDSDFVGLYTSIGEYFPLVFYLKKWHLGNPDSPNLNADIIIANQTSSLKLEPLLSKWKKENMVVRCWTFWTQPDLTRIPEFLVLRKPLTDVYCMNFTVYYRP